MWGYFLGFVLRLVGLKCRGGEDKEIENLFVVFLVERSEEYGLGV